MRIIGGTNRGIRLEAPEGDTTRPTSDRAREALFNIITHGRYATLLQRARVADIFAGTGAVGLEALSRGAGHCTFVEKSPAALKALKANIAKCRQDDRSAILATGATALPRQKEPFDLLFLDPPYGRGLCEPAIRALLENGWVSEGGLVIVQNDPAEAFDPGALGGLRQLDCRTYGKNRLFILER